MSDLTYSLNVHERDKPLVWFHSEVRTPPFSKAGRIQAGFLLRKLQQGEKLSLPHSRPMPSIGSHCHELRIPDETKTWRIIYRLDADAIIIIEVFHKTTSQTPRRVIADCKRRLKLYDELND